MNHRPFNCLVACVVATTLALASPALGRGGGGGHGGGFGGGHGGGWGGGMHAGWGGGMHAMGGGARFAGIGAARFAGPRFAGASFAHAGFSPRFAHAGFHHRFHHRFNRFAFVGFPYSYGYYDDCWRRIWTAYGPQWTNVCGDYGYY